MSLSLPNIGQPRRSKTILSPEGTTAKFLYTIIKQLDLKTIDWNEVASQLDITNGHAARMRYSRFKTQIEALLKEGRIKPRAEAKEGKTKSKDKGKRYHDGRKVDFERADAQLDEYGDDPRKRIKYDGSDGDPKYYANGTVKMESTSQDGPGNSVLSVKPEAGTMQARIHHPTVTDFVMSAAPGTLHPARLSQNHATTLVPATAASQPSQIAITKTEPQRINIEHATSQAYPATKTIMQHQSQYQYPYSYGRNTMTPYYPYGMYAQAQPSHNHFYTYTDPRFQQQYQQHYPTSSHSASAYEMAAQASYPWPPSESSIPRSIKKGEHVDAAVKISRDLEADIDFTQFASEFGDDWGGFGPSDKLDIAMSASETVEPVIASKPVVDDAVTDRTSSRLPAAATQTRLSTDESLVAVTQPTAPATFTRTTQPESQSLAVKTECPSPGTLTTSIDLDRHEPPVPSNSDSATTINSNGEARAGAPSQTSTTTAAIGPVRRVSPPTSHKAHDILSFEPAHTSKVMVKVEPEIEVL